MTFNVSKYEFLFQLLSVVNVAIICFTGVSFLTYGVFAYILILRLANKISDDEFIIYSLFVPNKYLQLLAIPIYVFLNPSVFNKRLNKLELIFIAYISVVGTVNCIVYSAMPLGTLFQVGVYYLYFKLMATNSTNLDNFVVLRIMDSMLPVQIISGAIQIIRYREIADAVSGTLISAHYLGVYLIIYILIFFRLKPFGMKNWELYSRIVISIFYIYLTDAKHVWVIFVFVYIVSWLLKKIGVKNKITFAVFTITFIVVGGTLLMSSKIGNDFLSNFSFARTYIISEQFNKKYVLFVRTFRQMISLNGIFGFGVGQYGSQISLTLSKGIIYWWDASKKAYHFAIQPYANAMHGIMTEWYTKYGIEISSMVLGYPLVSFIGLFAELGVCGYLMLLRIFEKRFRNDDPTFIIAFFLLSLFDTYFEIPCVFVLILVATYANSNSRKYNLVEACVN